MDISDEYDLAKSGLLKEFIKNPTIIPIIRPNMIIVVKFFDFIMIPFISRVVYFYKYLIISPMLYIYALEKRCIRQHNAPGYSDVFLLLWLIKN
ncbi:hypothetical protein yfred0001_37800 [Yersinia frederiksenii ATCC 33641]|nr:hypothetical protein yfred0001_37800 [Yersinia frederiksenii ATCC 33641]